MIIYLIKKNTNKTDIKLFECFSNVVYWTANYVVTKKRNGSTEKIYCKKDEYFTDKIK